MVKKGLVLKSTGSFYQLRLEDGEVITATLKGKLRIKGIRSTNPIAVGDFVSVENDTITDIFPRKNYIIRKATNLSKESHIVAANIDQALLLITLKSPATTKMFIDRFLISAEAYSIPVILIFNKIDLLSSEELEEMEAWKSLYEDIGYLCYNICAHNTEDIELIKSILLEKTSVISGHSGVGKSTLINALDSRWNLKTSEISTFHQSGKHTTTFAEMFTLDFGGYIIDTPGIRGFGLVDIKKEELAHYFREIFKLSHQCKYNNCYHIHEPNCAVREAVEQGYIDESRYNNYVRLFFDEDSKHRQ